MLYIDVVYYVSGMIPDDSAAIAKRYIAPTFDETNEFKLVHSEYASASEITMDILRNMDKFNKYRFVFKINDNGYTFESVKKI